MVAHIVAWHERLVAILTDLSNRRVPNYPEGTFSEINAAAIDSMAGVSTQTLCERLATAQQRLRALYQKVPDVSVAFKKGGAERKLPQAFTRMEPDPLPSTGWSFTRSTPGHG